MHLKSIEIHGFKSFANKAVLEFIPPKDEKNSITAIVGPNGAGKTTTMKMLLGGTRVKPGFYWNLRTWTLATISESVRYGASLPAPGIPKKSMLTRSRSSPLSGSGARSLILSATAM